MKDTRYQEGDKVKFENQTAEVLHIIEPQSDSPDYVVQGDHTAGAVRAKASELKKVDRGSGWKAQAVRTLENAVDANLTMHDTNSRGAKRRGTFSAVADDGREYEIFKDYNTARQTRVDRLKEDIEMNPNLISGWLRKDVAYVGSTDARMIAQDDARARTEDRNRSELENMADRYGADVSRDANIDKLREEVRIAMSEKFEKQINDDPIEYFSDIYGEDKVMEQSFMRIDRREAAQTAIQNDGLMHGSIWEEEYQLPNGAYAYRTNQR